MLRFYNYLYYRQYSSILSNGGNPIWASWSAFGCLSFAVVLNIVGLLSLFEVMTGNRILEGFVALPKPEQYGIMIIFVLAVLGIWGRDSSNQKFINEFENLNETKRQKRLRAIGIWIYQLAWIGITAGCLIVLRHRNFIMIHGGK